MGNTGITANTKAAVAGVKERRDEKPDEYGQIFKRSEELVSGAIAALDAFDLERLGGLMDENHRLLQQIEVSHPRLDELVEIANDAGALGAKMTGGGLGGYMVALAPDRDLQEKVAKAMESGGYEALKTSIGI
jgi:mevalonate kinase